jgi:queuine tRNA-ribosyltransferase
MHAALTEIVPHLPEQRPRYLMGVGTPADIVHAIGRGVDLFDCVLPTRNARNGQAFVSSGKLVVKNARYKNDQLPLDPTCECPVCTTGYTRSYIRHLYVAGEIFALRLLTLHNVHFYQQLVAGARRAILAGAYPDWAVRRSTTRTDEPALAGPSGVGTEAEPTHSTAEASTDMDANKASEDHD